MLLGAQLFFSHLPQAFLGTVAAVSEAPCDELFRCFMVNLKTLGLIIGGVRASNPGPFVPLQVKPIKGVQCSVGSTGDQPVLVRVFHPYYELTAVMSGKEPIEQGGPHIAYVRQPGRAGSKSDADFVGQRVSPI
jgi:hypothetical protein